MTTEEIWKPVVGWEGFYEVSDRGRIKSVSRVTMRTNGYPMTVRERIMKTHPDTSGRLQLRLRRPEVQKQVWVHREVLKAFVGPPPAGQEGRHLNDDALDNRLENLSWGTRSQNLDDLVRNGKHFQSNKTHCPQGHPYDEKNTYYKKRPNGRRARVCRECTRVADLRRYNKRRGLDT